MLMFHLFAGTLPLLSGASGAFNRGLKKYQTASLTHQMEDMTIRAVMRLMSIFQLKISTVSIGRNVK